MIDFVNETVIPIFRRPSAYSRNAIFSYGLEWVLKGTRAGKLESFVVAGRRFTTLESIQRFAQKCTAAADGPPAPSRSPRQREMEISIAERACEQAGL